MKNIIKRYMRAAIVLSGALLFAFYCAKTVELGLHRPPVPEISQGMSAEARAAFNSLLATWNNQFARNGFFALVGLFLVLAGAVPKKKIWIPKIAFSSGLVALIVHHVLADGKISAIAEKGFAISIFWIVAAFVVQACGMSCTVWRWKVLLEGQGFKIPLRHLVESFLIGRFVGSFAPGTSGLDGYRAYDISRYTGKVARSISVIIVEKLIGFFVLGTLLLICVPVGQKLFEGKAVNATALAMMGLVFSGMMLLSLILLFKPALIRWIVDKLVPPSSPVHQPIDKAIKAVTAYEKRKLHLLKATAIGFGVHLCTIFMYFCTSRAIGEQPAPDTLFVTAAMMIGATILPLSIAGIGMREGVFAFFLGPMAAIYAFGGYLVGEAISLLGGPIWLSRRNDYYEIVKSQRQAVNADVDDDENEEDMERRQDPDDAKPATPPGPLPSLRLYSLAGTGAGLMAGLAVALVDTGKLWTISIDLSLPWYAALIYGALLGASGCLLGAIMAVLGRLIRKPAAPTGNLSVFIGLSLFFAFAFAIGIKFLDRDVFEEKVPLLSMRMALSVLALGTSLAAFCAGAGFVLRKVLGRVHKRFVKTRFAVIVYISFTLLFTAICAIGVGGHEPSRLGPPPKDPRSMPNILLVMNDTHRADYAGIYGNRENLTPNLDSFAKDAVVFTHAFAQASWTRPSVATILTGRYPSSHTATAKNSILPDEVTTLAEVLSQGGFESIGVVANYNLTPFFNFDQGFYDYKYLEPSLPLWSNDAQSKLFLIEVLKKIKVRLRGTKEYPEDYYVVGETVTQKALERLDARDKSRPFFMFLSYMDCHDPYFRHPFDGYGISQRANPNPDSSMTSEMKALYKGEVKYWDNAFRNLMKGLKDRKLYENTLIAVTSDHGEEFGEHGGFWHGTTLYDEQLRVIFIVKYPLSAGIGGGEVGAWMRLIDVAPLIIKTVGLTIPKEMQGAPAPNGMYTPVFSEEDHMGNVLTSIRHVENGNEIKLIQANKDNPRGLDPLELYRTDRDPSETENLIGKEKSLVKKSLEMLIQSKVKARAGAVKALKGELSEEAVRQLGNLGYAEPKPLK
jgi:arylsulfatase A-like enzyme/uncharacterized membrane protein YbhN (UPF0104 family)